MRRDAEKSNGHPKSRRNIVADGLRHGVQFSQWNSDFELNGYVATSSHDQSPDLHGGRNIRGLIANFTTDQSCKIGNVSYPAGDQDITVANGECGKQIQVQGGSSVSVSDCSAQAITFQTIKGMPAYWPHNCSFTRCIIDCSEEDPVPESTANVYLDEFDEYDSFPFPGDSFLRATGIVFNECTFIQRYIGATSYNVNIQNYTDRSEFYFAGCSFLSYRQNDQIRFANLTNSSPRCYAFFQSCAITSDVSGTDNQFGIVIPNVTRISIGMSECIFVSDHSSVTKIVNDGSGNIAKLFNDNNSPTAW
ncbi:MAG: hypothetical protein HONBIEJF_00434 [Fimbriimonadaceae bacterium]|nr:hypothetical protein [Fimbriimonadaceae bacterium]